jgi:uncharacterized membrane protein (DUF485 family)
VDLGLKTKVQKGWMFLLFAAGDLAGAIVLLACYTNGWLGGGLALVGIAFVLAFAAMVMAILGIRELVSVGKETTP